MVQKDERARVFKGTVDRSSQCPRRFPEMTATIPDRKDPRARARTVNHTANGQHESTRRHPDAVTDKQGR